MLRQMSYSGFFNAYACTISMTYFWTSTKTLYFLIVTTTLELIDFRKL